MGAREDEVRERLRYDAAFYAEHCLRIAAAGGDVIPFHPKPAQQRLYDALEAQRLADRPQRAIVLKARKLGFSTAVQGLLMQRLTQMPNHRALVVAHLAKSAGELYDIGYLMRAHLPAELRPAIVQEANARERKYMLLGEQSRALRAQGEMGINSSLQIDTAKEAEAGRGITYHSLHLSEVAFYDAEKKLTALLNAVPKISGTLIVLESTAKGHNHFKRRWDEAVAGVSSYAPIFAPWHEEISYALRFDSPEDREEFGAGVGTGPFGEDEPRLVEEFGCTLEQLHWRRRVIVDDCESKVEVFKVEYPSSPEEAFLASGKHVFSSVLVGRVIDRVRFSDPIVATPDIPGPVEGVINASASKIRPLRSGSIEVPTAVEFVPRAATGFGERHDYWRLFLPSTDAGTVEVPGDGQFIEAVDVAGGEENTQGDRAFHAIEVIDHRTGEQVAEWSSRCDEDQLALEAFKAGMLFNEAWLGVEVTGGWGNPVVKRLWRELGYRRLYRRRPTADHTSEKQQDRLGWDTNRRTKPMLNAGMKELLREETDGIRSRRLAGQMTTYIRLPDGSTGPESGSFSDLLMAYMIAHAIRMEVPVRVAARAAGARSNFKPRDPKAGY